MYAQMHTQRNEGTKKWAMPSPDGVELGNKIECIKTKDKMATRRMDDKKKAKAHKETRNRHT